MNAVESLEKLNPTVAYGTPYKPETEQSTRNRQAVIAAVAKQFPDFASQCQPYVNVLTFRQWKARGFRVKSGEHGIRIPIYRQIEKDVAGQKVKERVRRTAVLFALPQVEKAQ